ncbi:MAG: response regulator [Fibrobacterota bacterium]
MKRILVVDDETSILELLKEFLTVEGFDVAIAPDGLAALDILKNDSAFDLILSDINMPRMKGFELLKHVEAGYPSIKRVLITAYNVEDYLALAVQYGITNIITKTTPFNFDEILGILNHLIDGDFFGLSVYLQPGSIVRRLPILEPHRIHEYAIQPVCELGVTRLVRNYEMVLVELINNAVYYGIKDFDPERKEGWTETFSLRDGEVDLFYGRDAEKCAISVRDNGGKLTKEKVLHWLSRQIQKDGSGLPLGLLDIHGRGLFISREYVDRLVINIDKGKRTEIITVLYHENIYKGHKPLLINEI